LAPCEPAALLPAAEVFATAAAPGTRTATRRLRCPPGSHRPVRLPRTRAAARVPRLPLCPAIGIDPGSGHAAIRFGGPADAHWSPVRWRPRASAATRGTGAAHRSGCGHTKSPLRFVGAVAIWLAGIGDPRPLAGTSL